MKKTVFVILSLFVSSLYSIAQEYTQILTLKNGSTMKGVILDESPTGTIKIKTDEGRVFIVKPNQIETITDEVLVGRKGNRQSPAPVVSTYTNTTSTHTGTLSSNEYDISGYRGFIDLGYTKGTGKYSVLDRVEISTSHGYQFNPYIFLGIGSGIHYYESIYTYNENGEETSLDALIVPIFADFRCNFTEGHVVPYFGLKAGYSIDVDDKFNDMGFYANPSFGLKVMVNASMAVNFNLGYTVQATKNYIENYTDNGDFTTTKESTNLGGLNFRVGFEF